MVHLLSFLLVHELVVLRVLRTEVAHVLGLGSVYHTTQISFMLSICVVMNAILAVTPGAWMSFFSRQSHAHSQRNCLQMMLVVRDVVVVGCCNQLCLSFCHYCRLVVLWVFHIIPEFRHPFPQGRIVHRSRSFHLFFSFDFPFRYLQCLLCSIFLCVLWHFCWLSIWVVNILIPLGHHDSILGCAKGFQSSGTGLAATCACARAWVSASWVCLMCLTHRLSPPTEVAS